MKQDGVVMKNVFNRLPLSVKRLTLNDVQTRGQCHAQWWQEVGWAVMDNIEFLDLRYHKIADVKQMLALKASGLRNMRTLKLTTAQTLRRLKSELKSVLPSHITPDFSGIGAHRSRSRRSVTASPVFAPMSAMHRHSVGCRST